jgi:hypothetical protein
MSFPPLYKLHDWIPTEKLDKHKLSEQHHSIHFLEKNPKFINWKILSANPFAIPLLEKHFHKIHWSYLSENENAIHLLKKNKKRIDWQQLSCNKNAIQLLEENLQKISWRHLCINENAIEILKQNLLKIDWKALSQNKNAIDILEDNFYFIDWNTLSYNENAISFFEHFPFKTKFNTLADNPNPMVVPLLLKNLNKIRISSLCSRKEPEILSYIQENFRTLIDNPWNLQSICENKDAFYIVQHYLQNDVNISTKLLRNPDFWEYISTNENSIHFLKDNIDKIKWDCFSSNPAIFILDKEEMKKQIEPFTTDLITYFYNPQRIKQFCKTHNILFEHFFNNY